MKFKRANPPVPDFQIAPMIDVVFLLLIFFIVSWQYAKEERDLSTKVPTSEEGEARARKSFREIIINIRQSGEVVVNREVLSHEQLMQKLQRITEDNRDQPVRLRGDADCSWQDITDVIDVCIKAGVWNYSFATKPPGS